MAASERDLLVHAYNTVNQTIVTLENLTDPLEMDGLVLRIDYLIRTLVNLNHSQTDEIISLLGEACTHMTSEAQEMQEQAVEFAPQVFNQRRGRPAFEIKEEQLSFLLEAGFTIPTIAQLLKVSTRTVERRMNKYGLSVSGEYRERFLFCPVWGFRNASEISNLN